MLSVQSSFRAMFGLLVAGFVAVGAFGVPSPARAAGNLVVNGGFETTTGVSGQGGYICTGTATACNAGSNVTSWTSTCNQANCGNGASVGSILFGGSGGSAFNQANGTNNPGIGLQTSAPNSPNGGNFIGIDGDPTYTVGLSQSVAGLSVGASYLLTFYEAADNQNGNTATTTSYWQVGLGNATQNSASQQSVNGGFSGWSLQSLTFVATTTTEVLNFIAKGSPSGVPPVSLLDGVSLTLASAAPVPEPAAWALLVVGLLAVGFVRGRGRSIGGTAA